MKTRIVCVLAGLALAPAAAMGQWSDNFDSYSAGSINGQGGWQGWDNVASAAGNVSTDVARSSPNSQAIVGSADSVRTYAGVTSGQWSYVAWQYIPQEFTGLTNFIMNNAYNDGGPYQWAVQLGFNATTGLVTDDNGRTENPISFVRGQWAEIRVDFDLTNNTIAEYYNGALLSTGTWNSASYPALAFASVDLFANTGSVVYYDDMSLTPVPAPASLGLLGLAGLVAGRRRRS
jgi:MYXO-CTERM domain-containing protein